MRFWDKNRGQKISEARNVWKVKKSVGSQKDIGKAEAEKG